MFSVQLIPFGVLKIFLSGVCYSVISVYMHACRGSAERASEALVRHQTIIKAIEAAIQKVQRPLCYKGLYTK